MNDGGFIPKNLPQKAYTTDFLFDQGIKFIKNMKRKNQHFTLTLSIPDPHGPYEVRAPYDTMYNNMTFNVPDTSKKAMKRNPALPRWARDHQNLVSTFPRELSSANERIQDEKSEQQHRLRQIFGMVKCIDDNVGKLLKVLKNKGLDENTIVVFTSDHGNLSVSCYCIDKEWFGIIMITPLRYYPYFTDNCTLNPTPTKGRARFIQKRKTL